MRVAAVRRRSCNVHASVSPAAASSAFLGRDHPEKPLRPFPNTNDRSARLGRASMSARAVLDSGISCGRLFLVRAAGTAMISPLGRGSIADTVGSMSPPAQSYFCRLGLETTKGGLQHVRLQLAQCKVTSCQGWGQ